MNVQQKLTELQKKYEEVENTNLTLSSQLSELFILYNLTRILSTTFDLNVIFKNIFKLFKESLEINYSSLIFVDEFAEKMNLEKKYGSSIKTKTSIIFPSKSVLDKIVKSKKYETRTITSFDEIITKNKEDLTLPLHFFGYPIIISDQTVIGSLCFFQDSNTVLSTEQIDFYHRITQEVSNILDKIFLFHQTKEDTYRDHLTGVYNRRYFNQRLEMEIKRAERYKRNISILMIDIDNFKQINDQYGHVEGDEVLKRLVLVLRQNLRNSDILVRFGGEEFVALLPETNSKNAYRAGEKLRTAVESDMHFKPLSLSEEQKITISIGVSNYPSDAYSGDSLILQADQFLYEAKRQGKNRTITST
jgi:diguanylate cyclase (GGDEF)-like protein